MDPKSWTENGGTIGSIRCRDGVFTIRQTPRNHCAVERLFEQLMQTRGTSTFGWAEMLLRENR